MNWVTFFRSFFNYFPSHHLYRAQARSFGTKPSIDENPYFSKYASKIAAVQKSSPEKLDATLRDQKEGVKPPPNLNETSRQQAHKVPYNRHQKDLKQILKIETVINKPAEEIEKIWKQYHSVKDGVYAVLPGDNYRTISGNLENFPTFLFPLPKAQGYEFMMCQYLDQSCYFTSLINYQAFKENAPVTITITYFTEFLEDKNIVLMRGEYDTNVLKVHEAQCLANQLQLYYGTSDKKKLLLLERFNKCPDDFKYMDLIANFEQAF